MWGSKRVDGMLQQMVRVLNSNIQFKFNDSFQLYFTPVHAAPQGSGRKCKLKTGHTNLHSLKRLKQSTVTIKNRDDLCCRRAIVTAKAKVDSHANWDSKWAKPS